MNKQDTGYSNYNCIFISVIIPCYNSSAYIEETLTSLRNQTFRAFEIICVNDGSTDNTLEILKKWKESIDFPMHIVTQCNSGVSKARNVGIELASGKYICFLDADDILHREYLSELFNLIEQNGVDTAYCLFTRNIESLKTASNTSLHPILQNKTQCMMFLMRNMGRVSFCCYIYKRELLNAHNIRFDENTRHFEDREFNWKYLSHCSNGMQLPCALYGYRVVEGSATKPKKVEWRTDSIEAVQRVEQYMRIHNCAFADQINDYLFPRVLLGMANLYVDHKEYEYCKKLETNYNMNRCMRMLVKKGSLKEKASALAYMISPKLLRVLIKANSKLKTIRG